MITAMSRNGQEIGLVLTRDEAIILRSLLHIFRGNDGINPSYLDFLSDIQNAMVEMHVPHMYSGSIPASRRWTVLRTPALIAPRISDTENVE